MDRPLILKTILLVLLPLIFISLVNATEGMKKEGVAFHFFENKPIFLVDSVNRQQRQDDKKDKGKTEAANNKEPDNKQKLDNKPAIKPDNKPDIKQKPGKPEIRKVPKARKQSRPIVVKPKVKVKPIKVVRPKIKKP